MARMTGPSSHNANSGAPLSDYDRLREAEANAVLRARRGKHIRKPPPPIGAVSMKIITKGRAPKLTGLEAVRSRWSEIAGPTLSKISYPDKHCNGIGPGAGVRC